MEFAPLAQAQVTTVLGEMQQRLTVLQGSTVPQPQPNQRVQQGHSAQLGAHLPPNALQERILLLQEQCPSLHANHAALEHFLQPQEPPHLLHANCAALELIQ